MLKLMWDGSEFRLNTGGIIDLSKAGITDISCCEVLLMGIDVVTFKATYTGKVEIFDSEFEFELWRNSLKSSGLYDPGWLSGLYLLIEGEKVEVSAVRPQVADAVGYYNSFPIILVVPIYKENQCI